jgi:hypothetical protein
LGVVSGNNIIDCIRGVEGTAQAHSGGAVVEIVISAGLWNKLITGVTPDTDGTLAANSDTKIPSQKAVKTYADTKTTLAGVQADIGIVSSYIQRQAIINGGMEVSQEDGTGTKALANNTAKYACDLFVVTPSGTAVSAGTQGQISNSIIGTSGFALKLAGVTITGAGTIKRRYRMEAADAVKFKNKLTSFSMQELQDTGGSLNYTIQINKANSADNFSAVTQIAISGSLAVPSATGTRIVLENVSMGDCSNGIEIVVTIPCGAITTKNFETTEWQMNVGAVVLPFVCGTRAEELAKVMRYWERTGFTATGDLILSGMATGVGNPIYVSFPFKVTKRIAVTASKNGTWQLANVSAQPTIEVTTIAGFRMVITATAAGSFYSVNAPAGCDVTTDARFTA